MLTDVSLAPPEAREIQGALTLITGTGAPVAQATDRPG